MLPLMTPELLSKMREVYFGARPQTPMGGGASLHAGMEAVYQLLENLSAPLDPEESWDAFVSYGVNVRVPADSEIAVGAVLALLFPESSNLRVKAVSAARGHYLVSGLPDDVTGRLNSGHEVVRTLVALNCRVTFPPNPLAPEVTESEPKEDTPNEQ